MQQQRSDAKIVYLGQCARSNLLCAARASCRQSRSAWSRRACRRHGILSQQPAISVVPESLSAVEPPSKCDITEVKCKKTVAPTVMLANHVDVTVEVADKRSEVDLAAPAEADLESDSITDLNTTDTAKDHFMRQVVASLQEKKVDGNRASSFESVSLPKVNLSSYASRIYKYLQCTDECFVLCLVYIDRIAKSRPDIKVTDFTSHRLFFISAVVAVKFHDDTYASNEYFAKVGGIEPTELNALEAEFLQLLDWRLYVGRSEYNLYLQNIRGQTLR